MMKKSVSIAFALIWIVVQSSGQQTENIITGGISGSVRFPDGMPATEAKVSAVTECVGMHFDLVQEVMTTPDGLFHIPAFLGADCHKVRLYAEKPEDLWLRTGKDIFLGENGTSPLVESVTVGPPARADITLGKRGGPVSFRVWDMATSKFIWATLELQWKPVPGANSASRTFATGRDGSSHALLLPAGEYVVSIFQYSCGSLDYFTARRDWEPVIVESGQSLAKDISVDVRLIKPGGSSSNPKRKPCRTVVCMVSIAPVSFGYAGRKRP